MSKPKGRTRREGRNFGRKGHVLLWLESSKCGKLYGLLCLVKSRNILKYTVFHAWRSSAVPRMLSGELITFNEKIPRLPEEQGGGLWYTCPPPENEVVRL